MEMEQTLYPELVFSAPLGSLSLGGDETEPHVRLSGVPHDDAPEFGCSANVGMRTPFFFSPSFFSSPPPPSLPPSLSPQPADHPETGSSLFVFLKKREGERAGAELRGGPGLAVAGGSFD